MRTLLLVFAVLSIALAYVGHRLTIARNQRDAIAELQGHAWYYHQAMWDQPSPFPGVVASEEKSPTWLRNVLGDDFFYDVDSVHLNSPKDEDLAHLARLPSVRSLALAFPQISDRGVAGLKQLKRLEYLDLNLLGDKLNITDEGAAALAQLPRLRHLNLGESNVSDQTLAHLKALTRLESLCLTNTQVTDLGLEHLVELPNLRELYLGGTRVTDAGLADLRQMPSLEVVDLSRTSVTPAGRKSLEDRGSRVEVRLR